jgi:hypothetical protein
MSRGLGRGKHFFGGTKGAGPSGHTQSGPGAVRWKSPEDRAGLRRVDWVRLVVGDEAMRAEVMGVGFRLPVTRPISLSTAADLIAMGTPCVTRHLGSRPVQPSASGT